MLQNTFIHLDGIGRLTEQRLWAQGVRSWDDCLSPADDQLDLGPEFAARGLRGSQVDQLHESRRALQLEDAAFFAGRIPRNQLWRLYGEFWRDTVFLDIETTGLSRVYDRVTLVGLYSERNGYQAFLPELGMTDGLRETLASAKMLVTFNGTLFDIPFLNEKLQGVELPPAHVDLRFVLRTLGYSGGLKSIEKAVGLERSASLREINGYEATILWSRFTRGNRTSLRDLILYNGADTANLRYLMDMAYRQLAAGTLPEGTDCVEVPQSAAPQIDALSESSGSVGGFRFDVPEPPERRFTVSVDDLLARAYEDKARAGARIVGIDLTGSEARATGWALLDGSRCYTARIHTDADLIHRTIDAAPTLISIDSPLGLPRGRTLAEDETGQISRECERYLKRIGISVFWCLLPSMRGLTARGIRLAEEFRELGYEVIESFPGAAQDILQIPRKKASLEELSEGLAQFGLVGEFVSQKVSHDELDAITSALVGLFYLSGDYVALGHEDEGHLIVPEIGDSQ